MTTHTAFSEFGLLNRHQAGKTWPCQLSHVMEAWVKTNIIFLLLTCA